jgi:predicted MFS family arabinose efflux permease
MAWWRLFSPSLRDGVCLAVFLAVNAGSFVFSYFFLIDKDAGFKAARMQLSILIYGSAQSLIGYLGGFCIARMVYCGQCHARPREYEFVKSDDDILD